MQGLGRRIRAFRQTQSKGLADVATATGLSKGYLSELERSEDANPSLDVMKRVADALGVTLAELLGAPRIVPSVSVDDIPTGLVEFAKEQQAAGRPLQTEEIVWLANARYRGERRPRSKEDFAYLYRSLSASAHGDDGDES